MELAKSIFDKEAFRKVHRDYIRLPPINKALFDALSTQFALLTEEEKIRIRQNKAEFKRRLRSLIAEDDYFFTSITSSTGDKRRVTYRHSSIKDLIQDVITNRI